MASLEHLEHFLRDMRQHEVTVLLCGVRPDLAARMSNLRFNDWLPSEHVFLEEPELHSSTLKAVRYAYQILPRNSCLHCGPEAVEQARDEFYYLVWVTIYLTDYTGVVESSLPHSRVYANTGECIEQEGLVEFRLIYEGEVLSSGNRGSTVSNKHAIRKALHPQLRRLWKIHAGIRQYAKHQYDPVWGVPTNEDEHVENGLKTIAKRWQRAGLDFVPLVTPEYALRCALDILLLRPADERFIFRRGDLDGQVKTLFDALRIADNADETGGVPPTQDETPFYCLLSDDRLISEVRVIDDQLLLLPHAKQVAASDSFVVIHVRINYQHGGPYDRYFE